MARAANERRGRFSADAGSSGEVHHFEPVSRLNGPLCAIGTRSALCPSQPEAFSAMKASAAMDYEVRPMQFVRRSALSLATVPLALAIISWVAPSEAQAGGPYHPRSLYGAGYGYGHAYHSPYSAGYSRSYSLGYGVRRYSAPIYHAPSVHIDHVYHPEYYHWTPGRGLHSHGHYDAVPHYTPGHFDHLHGNHIHGNPHFDH
jgi:hypothetical protein